MAPEMVNLVVEDSLSEAICRRILSRASRDVGVVYGKEGFGYVKTRLCGFNNAAKSVRYLVLVDLDRFHCAAGLWTEWVPGIRRHPNLLFRVAVREVEAWLLADTANLSRFFGIKQYKAIPDPDKIRDPKSEVLKLASRSPRRAMREAVTFKDRRGVLVQGPDYNGTLCRFVEKAWDLETSIQRSESLRRAVRAVQNLG
jgi:hypothetical protein